MQTNLGINNQTVPDLHSTIVLTEPHSDFAFLSYLRIIFYVFIAIKLVEIIFMRRKKLKISERIQRKFLFAHGIQMIKGFSAQEFQLMNLTLQNTLKNAIQPFSNNPKKNSAKVKKSVSFLVQSNVYYDPPETKIHSTSEIDIKQVAPQESAKRKEDQTAPLLPNIEQKQQSMQEYNDK